MWKIWKDESLYINAQGGEDAQVALLNTNENHPQLLQVGPVHVQGMPKILNSLRLLKLKIKKFKTIKL